jgi:hypothetical protein
VIRIASNSSGFFVDQGEAGKSVALAEAGVDQVRVFSVRTKAEFPELLLARTQILTMASLRGARTPACSVHTRVNGS